MGEAQDPRLENRLSPSSRPGRMAAGAVATAVVLTGLHFLLPAREDFHVYHLLLVAAYFLPLLQITSLGIAATLAFLAGLSAAMAGHAWWSWHGHRVLQTELLSQIGTFWLVGLASAALFSRLREEERRSHRMERDLLLARAVQESLQPGTPLKRGGFEIAARSEPAHEVGGDLVDYFELDDGTIAFFIGDVAGKGLGAAFHAVVVRGLVRRYARMGLSPGRTLARLNRFLLTEGDGGVFVSAFLGYLDPVSGTVSGCCAGHEPPVHLGRAGPRRLDVPANLVLGAAPGAWRSLRIRMHPGEGLVLYTDGVSETRNSSGREFGAEGVLATLQGGAGDVAPALVDRLLGAASRHGGRRDDRTALALLRSRS